MSIPHRSTTRRAALLGLFPLAIALGACAQSGPSPAATEAAANAAGGAPTTEQSETMADASAAMQSEDMPAESTQPEGSMQAESDSAVAIFAGGCFWCMEPPYDKLPGVSSTISGYIGGNVANPTYEQVSAGGTGHTEAVKVSYDPDQVGYAKLLEVFWHNIDPVAVDRQFCDVGTQYRSAIFYGNAKQRQLAEAGKRELEQSGRFERPIATEIVPATTFYPAEDYHQNYYKKNPVRYKFYRWNCGRDARLEELWG